MRIGERAGWKRVTGPPRPGRPRLKTLRLGAIVWWGPSLPAPPAPVLLIATGSFHLAERARQRSFCVPCARGSCVFNSLERLQATGMSSLWRRRLQTRTEIAFPPRGRSQTPGDVFSPSPPTFHLSLRFFLFPLYIPPCNLVVFLARPDPSSSYTVFNTRPLASAASSGTRGASRGGLEDNLVTRGTVFPSRFEISWCRSFSNTFEEYPCWAHGCCVCML